jgi:hypothetical protein
MKVTVVLSVDPVGLISPIRMLNGMLILPSNNGKLLIYAPRISGRNDRLKTVGRAVVRVAEMLGTDIEISQRRNVLSVWVYYKTDGKEKTPVYFDWGKNWSEDAVFQAITSKLYGLSFSSEHAVLQVIRRR